jgi:hypothetical protein
VNAIPGGAEPTYGPYQARLDHELILAIRKSSDQDGQPVQIPLI